MDKQIMIKALKQLDSYLKEPAEILIGGGAAMILAYDIPLSTMDIDGLLMGNKISAAELDPLVKKVAKDLGINPHWFNSYFDTYTYTIPSDFNERTKQIFKGKYLTVDALGLEELLVMKCFAGREKDIGHARGILKKGVKLDLVEAHMESLAEKGVPGAPEALGFFVDLKDQLGM